MYIADSSGSMDSATYYSHNNNISLDDIKPGFKGLVIQEQVTIKGMTIQWFSFVHIITSELGYDYKGKLCFGYQYNDSDKQSLFYIN